MSTNQPGGTSGKVKLPDIEAASKSGTAQTTDNGKKSNNSWVMSFAPYQKPKYAICVLVQNGGSGGGVCGPLVNLVYRGLFARDNNGILLPLKPQNQVPGNTDRIEKSIEISPEMIAAVEAGDTAAAAIAAAAAAATPLVAAEEDPEKPAMKPAKSRLKLPPAASTAVTPTPTITPEIDAEGTVIPRAVPVAEP